MKIRIANVLDGAAQTLLLAGTLGIPTAVLAETVPYPPLGKPVAVSHGVGEVRPLPQTAKHPRVLEIRVELAWLADSLTSPWRLEARTDGSRLEVHGEVPNQAVLAHALQLARAESGMQVVSKLQLNPRLRAPAGSKSQDVLHREAFNALRRGFPEQAPSITVGTLADGQIVLKGTVQTYEDKMAVSRHLRQVTACSCVINQLQVLAEPPEGQGQSSSRAATATLLRPEAFKPQPTPSLPNSSLGTWAPVQPVAHLLHPPNYPLPTTAGGGEGSVRGQEMASLATAAHVPHSSAETMGAGGSSSGRKASATGSEDSSSPRSAAQSEAASPHPAPEKQTTTAAKPAAKPLVYQTKWRRMDPSEYAMPTKVVVPKESASAKMQEAPGTSPKAPQTFLRVIPSPNGDREPHSSGSALAKAETATLPKQSLQLQSSSIQPLVGSADVSEHKNRPVPLRIEGQSPFSAAQNTVAHAAKPSLASTPAAPPQTAWVARREPYVSEGVILVESAIKPASHTPPANGEKPPIPLRTGAYVTSGMILFSDSANEELLHSNPAFAALQTRLQQRIAAVCGKSIKDVEVTAVSETDVAVRVKAYSNLEGEELSNRIFQLPELGPCQVSLDVLLMK